MHGIFHLHFFAAQNFNFRRKRGDKQLLAGVHGCLSPLRFKAQVGITSHFVLTTHSIISTSEYNTIDTKK